MNNRLTIALLVVCWTVLQLQAQTVSGNFPQLKGKEVKLMAFNGFVEKVLAKTQCDSLGRFQFNYPASYTGAALLQPEGARGAIVLLNHENLGLKWGNMQEINTLEISGSLENDAFAQGMAIHAEAEQKLSALRYLLSKYNKQSNQYTWLQAEIASQEKQFQGFVNQLSSRSYAASYLKMRKFVADMAAAFNRKDTTGLAQIESAFSQFDFATDAFWQSGLAIDVFTGIYTLMDSYQDVKIISEKSNQLTAIWIENLAQEPLRQQTVAEYCFKLLEKKGLTASSEYLAKSMLSKSACQLDKNTTMLFDQYRKMAEGNTAPDMDLPTGRKLSKLKGHYKLVVFGASWCPDCQNDYPSLVGTYKRIKDKYDVGGVYISLDTDKKAYQDFYKGAPFTTACDTDGWSSSMVKEFCVVATPTLYILDENLRILKKVSNAHQLEEFFASL